MVEDLVDVQMAAVETVLRMVARADVMGLLPISPASLIPIMIVKILFILTPPNAQDAHQRQPPHLHLHQRLLRDAPLSNEPTVLTLIR